MISDGAGRRLRVRLGEEHLMVDCVRELRGILREQRFQVGLQFVESNASGKEFDNFFTFI